ncbi:MAG: hypothetical protein IPG69_04865 [Flavobacteriales bacterium]|nr:hypothetical protein [Flavobacteriales bacterium]
MRGQANVTVASNNLPPYCEQEIITLVVTSGVWAGQPSAVVRDQWHRYLHWTQRCAQLL